MSKRFKMFKIKIKVVLAQVKEKNTVNFNIFKVENLSKK